MKKVIDWYEGQPSSNALIRRLRNNYPSCPTVAYVASPCSEYNSGLYPSQGQVEAKTVAEYYAIQGEYWKDMVTQFTGKVDCITAPSFRHQGVFEARGEDVVSENKILIVLSYFVDTSTQLLKAFFEAAGKESGFSVYIKNHPSNYNYTLDDYGILPDLYRDCDVTFLSGNLSDALPDKEVVICSETTSVLEMILYGKHVISFIPSGRLHCTCLPPRMDGYKHLAYDAQDIKEYIIHCRNRAQDDRATALRDYMFTNVDDVSVRDFLELRHIV